jgi:hypothetical protein
MSVEVGALSNDDDDDRSIATINDSATTAPVGMACHHDNGSLMILVSRAKSSLSIL